LAVAAIGFALGFYVLLYWGGLACEHIDSRRRCRFPSHAEVVTVNFYIKPDKQFIHPGKVFPRLAQSFTSG